MTSEANSAELESKSESRAERVQPARPILELKVLKKYFRLQGGRMLHAVDGVSLSVGEREVVGLVGESGCGKSTLGKTAVGLLDKTAGEVHYRGERLPAVYGADDFRKYARKVHMIFQDPYSSLDPRMTVREIIAEGPRIHGMWSRAEVSERVAFCLERVGLAGDYMSRYAHEFSGGQRQRIGVARALALRPKLIVCDEPVSALDVSVQAQILNLFRDLREQFGLGYVFITHDLAVVRQVVDRVYVLHKGVVVEQGLVDQVLDRPEHPYTERLIASIPRSVI
jgi:ABC-type oligopeptide transport system ATPase subunit